MSALTLRPQLRLNFCLLEINLFLYKFPTWKFTETKWLKKITQQVRVSTFDTGLYGSGSTITSFTLC